jgi:hypothetical protein
MYEILVKSFAWLNFIFIELICANICIMNASPVDTVCRCL